MDGNIEEDPGKMKDVEISNSSQPGEKGELNVNADVDRYNVSQQIILNGSSEINVKTNNEDGTVNQEDENRLQQNVEIKETSNNEDGTVDQKNNNRTKENSEIKANSYIDTNTVDPENGNKTNKVIEDNNLPPLPEADYSSDSSSNSENHQVEIRKTKNKIKGTKVARLTEYFNKEFAAIRKKREEEAIIQSQQTYKDSDVVFDQSHEIVFDQPQDEEWNQDYETHTWDEIDLHQQNNQPQNFIVYKQRWAIIITLALLNFSNASLWINVAPISTIAVSYFQKSEWEINLFSIIYMIINIPLIFIATYIIKKTNIRTVMHMGAALNSLGAIIRTVAMIQSLDINMQFYLSIIGQVSCALAFSFVQYLPAKVAQTWFPEAQRVQATTIGFLGQPLGIIVINIIAPLIVNSPDQFPIVNYVCLVPALLAETLVTFCVNRSHPPTPPSEATLEKTKDIQQDATESNPVNFSYGAQLRSAFCNFAYIIIVVIIGGGLAFFSAISTLAQQMLCTVGYSNVESGLSIACLYFFGFVGAAVITTYASRTGYLISISKACWAGCSFFGVLLFMLYLIPGQAVLLCICSSVFGFFGVGIFSVGLELAVEATYPVEPAISSGFIHFFGQMMATLNVIVVLGLSREISHSEHSVCSEDVPLHDFTYSIIYLMVFLGLGSIFGIVLFKTPYKRRDAGRQN